MPLANLLTRTVTILTPGTTTDRYNNIVADWTAPTERSARAWFAQQTSTEDHTQRDAQVTEGTATFAPDVGLSASDRVVVDGATYEVVGVPNVAWTPRGPHHVEAHLRAVVG